MKKEFIVNRQGKDHVLYAGLLDEAYRQGLKRISTKLLQAPTEANGQLAICWAEVETEKGVFSGIGDASPQNVGRMIAPHITRMAETRSKARALRDALNIGMLALEELGGEEDPPERPRQQQQNGAQQQRPSGTPPLRDRLLADHLYGVLRTAARETLGLAVDPMTPTADLADYGVAITDLLEALAAHAEERAGAVDLTPASTGALATARMEYEKRGLGLVLPLQYGETGAQVLLALLRKGLRREQMQKEVG